MPSIIRAAPEILSMELSNSSSKERNLKTQPMHNIEPFCGQPPGFLLTSTMLSFRNPRTKACLAMTRASPALLPPPARNTRGVSVRDETPRPGRRKSGYRRSPSGYRRESRIFPGRSCLSSRAPSLSTSFIPVSSSKSLSVRHQTTSARKSLTSMAVNRPLRLK